MSVVVILSDPKLAKQYICVKKLLKIIKISYFKVFGIVHDCIYWSFISDPCENDRLQEYFSDALNDLHSLTRQMNIINISFSAIIWIMYSITMKKKGTYDFSNNNNRRLSTY